MRSLLAAAAVGAVGLAAAPAQAQALRPDTLQTLGVGARATGLGGAFVSVANDVTASFWNPAGLTRLEQMQLAADFRMLPKADLDLRTGFSSDIGSTDLQFSFFGLSIPLGKEESPAGALGFSRTLGGYEQTNTRQIVSTGELVGDEIARYWFNTVAYGRSMKQVPGDLKIGVAAHWVQLNTLVAGGIVGGRRSSLEDGGNGVTFSLGALYQANSDDRLTLGFTYLNPTSIGGLDDAAPTFGDRVPGRVSGGASYVIAGGKGQPTQLLGSFELRHSFGADNDSAIVEGRESTTNYHIGAEYRRNLNTDNLLFLRGGFFTRNSSNDQIFFDDRVATIGFGYEKRNLFSADVAVEISTETGDPLVTTSLRYRIGALRGGK